MKVKPMKKLLAEWISFHCAVMLVVVVQYPGTNIHINNLSEKYMYAYMYRVTGIFLIF